MAKTITFKNEPVHKVSHSLSNTIYTSGRLSILVISQMCMWSTPAFTVVLKTKVHIAGLFYFFGTGLYRVINVIPINSIGPGAIIPD